MKVRNQCTWQECCWRSQSGLGLPTVSPLFKRSRAAVHCLAGMFLVFAIWAALGFGYPSRPLLVVLNAIGKVLAFAAAVGLFLPGWEGAVAQNGRQGGGCTALHAECQ
jgi:hypothetical protein